MNKAGLMRSVARSNGRPLSCPSNVGISGAGVLALDDRRGPVQVVIRSGMLTLRAVPTLDIHSFLVLAVEFSARARQIGAPT